MEEKVTENRIMMLNKKIGVRLKGLIKEYDTKHEVTAKYLGYSTGSISRFCSGKETLPDAAIEKLSKRWNVRKEYIKCIDDFKTDADLLSATEMQNQSDFLRQKDYLETLGLSLDLQYTLFCPKTAFYRHREEIMPYLVDSCLEEILHDPDYTLPSQEFLKKNFSETVCLHLKKPFTDELVAQIGTVHKHSIIDRDSDRFDNFDVFDISCTDNPLGVNVSFKVAFRVYYNHQYVGDYGIREIQRLLKIIDAYTRCTLETLLVNEYKLYPDED